MTGSHKIGWIGAGKMGLPIARRLKAAGHDVTVLARSAARAKELEAAGLKSAPSVASLARGADIVFASITDDKALQEVVMSSGLADHLPAGGSFIDISTVSPAMSASVAAILDSAGIAYLRSPVSGSTIMAEAGTLTAMVSGPRPAFEALTPIFTAFTKKAFYVGEREQARFLKLAINSMVAATPALLGEALAFGLKGGLTLASMMEVFTQSVVASPLMAYKKDMIVSGDYKPAATLNMLAKDGSLLLEAGKEAGAALPLSEAIRSTYEASASRGLGEQDFFVLVQEAQKAGA